MSEKLEWDSSLSFILAMIGAAVGLEIGRAHV